MKRLIIDTDPGVDDSMAILFALQCSELQLEALTTVFGSLFQTQKVYVDVEIGEQRGTGQTIADWQGKWEQPANVNVCLDVDSSRFLDPYYERITKK